MQLGYASNANSMETIMLAISDHQAVLDAARTAQARQIMRLLRELRARIGAGRRGERIAAQDGAAFADVKPVAAPSDIPQLTEASAGPPHALTRASEVRRDSSSGLRLP